ncbi:MAG: NADP-dependent malic enzyme [Lachnospiraceae bacterium]|jgi:Malic enzyme|nr:NADP-dependent malic enzyme [Lachnospiraceae bacterium]MCI8827176.1 NADP-dependent malic enzyme [Lachnospiraceae bacterium]
MRKEEKRNFGKESLQMHYEKRGKIAVISTVSANSREDLSLAYTPGVAEPCLEIQKNPKKSFELTRRWNLCLVVTDGSAVLGLGDIGPEAAMPVMEGKCVLFQNFGNVDAFPLCIRSKDTEEIVNTIALISGSFGGINLEDISAPRCFEIEKKLKECCDIPVFHDDQHGTAIVTLAGLINALKLVKKSPKTVRVVVNGAGAAAVAITKLLFKFGIQNITLCDRTGAIYKGRTEGMNSVKEEIAEITNQTGQKGVLKDIISHADIFIGVSAPGVLTEEMIASMSENAIIFACANPVPEIYPEQALRAGARVVATGRSDYPNQINNVLAFPGIFRGVFDVRAREINDEMKLAAAYAIADLVTEQELREDYIIPEPFDQRVGKSVAAAVAKTAVQTGVAEIQNTISNL